MLTFAQHAVWRDNYYAATLSSTTGLFLLFLSHWSLVGLRNNVKAGQWLRRVILPLTLYFVADVMLNRSYSLGSPLRNTAFLAFGWHFFAKALDIGLVYDIELSEGKPLPRWCVPDWDKEEEERKERGLNGIKAEANGKLEGNDTKPCWWQRGIHIRTRPQWAKEEGTIPRHWRLLPLPSTLADQLIWTRDVMYLRLVGTSTLFPNEMRALDWSMKKLVTAGEAQHKRRLAGKAHETSDVLVKEVHPFGYIEMPLVYMLGDLALLVWAYIYWNNLDYAPSTYNSFFRDIPFLQQCILSIATGAIIAMSSSPIDYVMIPLQLRWPFKTPPTALSPSFRDVSRSQSITEMWGWRWHKRSQRDFIRLSRLIPVGSPTNRVAALLKAFYWSSLYHSIILLRDDPPQSWSRPWDTLIKPIFLRQGTTGFFMVNGLICLFESAAAPLLWRAAAYFVTSGRSERSPTTSGSVTDKTRKTWQDDMKTVLAAEEAASKSSYSDWRTHWRCYVIWLTRIVWVWSILLWTGRWLAAECYAAGYMERENVASMGLCSQATDHYNYLRASLPPFH